MAVAAVVVIRVQQVVVLVELAVAEKVAATSPCHLLRDREHPDRQILVEAVVAKVIGRERPAPAVPES
jgi:hypothetical protein